MSLGKSLQRLLLASCTWAAITGAAGAGVPAPPVPAASGARAANLVDRSDTDRGAVLRGSAAVEFELPPNASSARLLLNPGIGDFDRARSSRLSDPQLRLRYAVHVQAIGPQGRILFERSYSFRRDLQQATLPSGERTTGAFYLERTAPTPLRSDEVLLEFQGLANPARLRVLLQSADGAIADVLARVYAPVPLSRRDAAVQWQRLSPEQRARMASGNLFPPQVLSQDERARLVVSRWAPVAPRRGAAMRELYVVRDLPPTEQVDSVPPPLPGLPVGPGQVATLPLPTGTRNLRLQLSATVAPGDKAPSAGDVLVRWAGESVFQRHVSAHGWKGAQPLELRLPHGPGWIEVESPRSATLRAWADRAEGSVEVTPEPAFLRVWSVNPDQALTYDITHAGMAGTPLRLVFRRLAFGTTASDVPAQVELLRSDDTVLKRAEVPLIIVRSVHDHPAEAVPGLTVTEPTETYFRVPPEVSRVRITSTVPLLAAGATRPAGLPRQVRTPEDGLAAAGEQGPIPAWFTLRPLDHEARLVNGATKVLRVQSRPPEDRPELMAGQYAFEDFTPVTPGAARVFLAPREPGVPDRDEALSSTYRPLPAHGRVLLRASPGRQRVQPRLAWSTDGRQRQPFRYRITVDDQPALEGAAAGQAGELLLPELGPGQHVVRVQAQAPVRWFINHINQGEAWVRREALQLDRPLAFEVDRRTQEREFISVRMYQPSDVRESLRVRVRIEAPAPADPIGPLPGWLFEERVHDVQPTGEIALPVAETLHVYADAGRSFLIPLPLGAPRGRYRITLEPQRRTGWMTLSRVTPGFVPQRRVVVEGSTDAQ